MRPAGAPGYAAIQQIADAGANPDVEMSINGVGYLTWSANGDVLAARLERNATTFNGVPGPLDIDPAATAGTGTGRPKVAVAADGIATVVWGEGGHAYARRIFELRLSAAPQDLGEGADEPDISSEDDSSFAWAVFRQGGQAIARRLVGSQFDPPVPHRGRRGPDAPRVAINGRGVGYAGVAAPATFGAYGAVLKDDVFNPGALIGGGFGGRRCPCRRWPRAATASSPSSRATPPAGARSTRGPTTTCRRRGSSRRPAPTRRSPTPRSGRPTPRAGSRPPPTGPATSPWPSSRATATAARSSPPATTARRAPSAPARRPSGASSRARR